jgi:hypothetical protein
MEANGDGVEKEGARGREWNGSMSAHVNKWIKNF